MTIQNPRSRMISVRLSKDELSNLQHLCSVTGARSVSDLTRDAIRSLLNDANRDDVVTIHLDEFHSRMESLEQKLEKLVIDIASLKATGGGE
jgi:hypothetical protein